MFCSNCGEKLKDDVIFCGFCGKKVMHNSESGKEECISTGNATIEIGESGQGIDLKKQNSDINRRKHFTNHKKWFFDYDFPTPTFSDYSNPNFYEIDISSNNTKEEKAGIISLISILSLVMISGFLCLMTILQIDNIQLFYNQNLIVKDNIPRVNYTTNRLTSDPEILKKYLEGCLLSDYSKESAINVFELKKMENVSVYYNYNKYEYIGVEDKKIVFDGIWGIDGRKRVNDFITDIFLDVEPLRYPLDSGSIVYIWKINNGYLAIYVVELENLQWYDNYVSRVLYINNKEMLRFIKE